MAFHKSDPTRVWKFGALPPRDQEGKDAIAEQYYQAHRYYNSLIALERQRRAQIEQLIRAHSPAFVQAEQKIKAIEEELRLAQEDIKQARQEKQSRKAVGVVTATIKDIKKRLAEARATARDERKKLWGQAPKRRKKERRRSCEPIRIVRTGGNKVFLGLVEKVENNHLKQTQQQRAASGCYWGTYLLVEKAFAQACQDSLFESPHFRRWDGSGLIGVQLQGGLSAKDALAGTDSRLRLILEEDHRSSRGQNGQAWLRIGTIGKEPAWAKFAFRLHRPLPEDAVIKWVTVARRRLGFHATYPFEPIYRYHLILTISNEEGFPEKPKRAREGTVAVNTGWRALPDGSLRVATWLGDDGQQGFLTLSADEIRRWTKAGELRSIRDRLFDQMRDHLGAWLEQNAAIVPVWLAQTCATIAQWKSPARLAGLVNGHGEWPGKRFAGDEKIFDLLSGWAIKNNHLEQWETNNRRKAIAWRDKLYEAFALDLCQRYRTLKIGEIDQRQLALRLRPEDDKAEPAQQARRNRTIAAPGRIGECLAACFDKSNIVTVPPEGLTQTCPFCGCDKPWDAAPAIEHACEGCGRTFDQDVGHCQNLLT